MSGFVHTTAPETARQTVGDVNLFADNHHASLALHLQQYPFITQVMFRIIHTQGYLLEHSAHYDDELDRYVTCVTIDIPLISFTEHNHWDFIAQQMLFTLSRHLSHDKCYHLH